ncbi:MAG TPA: hypothetical protein VFW13_15775 [Phenylobacterium sp.]|nr:hypothetical protein [Phenylobacterium sp.]
MRFVSPGAPCEWALLDAEARVIRHLAGPLSAWAPRIAFGEGCTALPLNGRREVWRETEGFKLGRHFRRLFSAPCDSPSGLLAAVMGAAPMGASSPLRCVVGYVEAQGAEDRALRLGPVLLSADEFGPSGPRLSPNSPPIADQLTVLEQLHGLRTGDVVVLGPAELSASMWAALRNEGAETGCDPAMPGGRGASGEGPVRSADFGQDCAAAAT